MGDTGIPHKLYYRIGEVAEIAEVKPHVLRYWETEFGFLSPQKNEGNQRLYSRSDLEKVLLIRKLLYEDKFTIAGAKKKFRESWRAISEEMEAAQARDKLIGELKSEVSELKALLTNN